MRTAYRLMSRSKVDLPRPILALPDEPGDSLRISIIWAPDPWWHTPPGRTIGLSTCRLTQKHKDHDLTTSKLRRARRSQTLAFGEDTPRPKSQGSRAFSVRRSYCARRSRCRIVIPRLYRLAHDIAWSGHAVALHRRSKGSIRITSGPERASTGAACLAACLHRIPSKVQRSSRGRRSAGR